MDTKVRKAIFMPEQLYNLIRTRAEKHNRTLVGELKEAFSTKK